MAGSEYVRYNGSTSLSRCRFWTGGFKSQNVKVFGQADKKTYEMFVIANNYSYFCAR